MASYLHCYLWCQGGHPILLPLPTPQEKFESPQLAQEANQKKIFVCPECGLGSVYAASELRHDLLDKPDQFVLGARLLVSGYIECDQCSSQSRTVIHTVIGGDTKTWIQQVSLADWHFDASVHCAGGHPLQPPLAFELTQCRLPF